MGAGYGNCLEVSCAAIWCLHEVGYFWYDMVYYPAGADHIFVVLHQRVGADGVYPTDFANWDAEAVVCDVWADIACPAQEYATRWRARMNNWNIMGITIGMDRPTNPTWLDCVDLPKKSYLIQT